MEGDVDVAVLGTGLTESITVSALSKAGYKVAHIDVYSYYGADEASLSLDELIQWVDERSSLESEKAKFTSISRSAFTLPQSRQYAISLAPSLIPSVGPIISSLVLSGVARYGGYRLLERVGVYDISGTVKSVPGSKEDVFKNKDISLVDKRRLMRFLVFAAGEFEDKKEFDGHENTPFLVFLKIAFALNEEIAGMIAYSLAYCVSASDTTLPALVRIRKYLRSAGRYGASSFLVGHYGGSGEMAQGFCRTAAVAGGIYVLGRRVSAITGPKSQPISEDKSASPPRYSVELEDFPEKLTCNLIISSKDHVPPHLLPAAKHVSPSTPSNGMQSYSSVARCIAIIDRPISFSSIPPQSSPSETESPENPASSPDDPHVNIDTAVLIFPPSSLPGGSATTAVHVLFTGEACMATPSGKWILYLSMPLLENSPSSPETILKPYLKATLSLTIPPSPDSSAEPLFTTHYIQRLDSCSTSYNPSSFSASEETSTLLITPSPSTILPESSDSAATNAEAVFRAAIHTLKSIRPTVGSANLDDDGEMVSFWPPIERNSEDEADEW